MQPKIIGYLVDYGLTYDDFITYMSIDGVWGDLVCNYVLAKCLPVLYKVVTPTTTCEFNEDKHIPGDPDQLDIVVVYNGFNHYISSSKYKLLYINTLVLFNNFFFLLNI